MITRTRLLALIATAAFLLLAVAGSAADSFTLTVVGQTTNTITFSYPQQPGYGYLFSANGTVVSRTNDPTRTQVKFAKASSYEVAAIVKGTTGSYPTAPPPPPPPPCSLNATPSNFAAQVAAASSGQTICLASGNYGTWSGTNKAITIKAADGASPQMKVSFGSGDANFTLDGMVGMGGDVRDASNVTIQNSVFTSPIDFQGNNQNVVLDRSTFNWFDLSGQTGHDIKINVDTTGTHTLVSPAVTISNNDIENGDLDGVRVGIVTGLLVLNNRFVNICEAVPATNHTDNIQFYAGSGTASQVRIAGNYVYASSACGTQGIAAYDGGTSGIIIENNVVDITRPWGIELYADKNSIVRHNTVVFHPDSGCAFTNLTCGKIDINRKSVDPAGTGTHVYDNLAQVQFQNGSTGTADHNVSSENAVYVGPTNFHDGFLLSSSSPVGRNAASDGTDAGVYRSP